MDERRAREVTLLEAFETAQPASPSWSDDRPARVELPVSIAVMPLGRLSAACSCMAIA